MLGIQAKGRINLLLKHFHTYKAGPEKSVDEIASVLENIKLEIADIKESRTLRFIGCNRFNERYR